MRNFSETVDYLYTLLPAFQREGAAAAKYDLKNITRLCQALGNPQQGMRFIHVAGTNGKGSVCAMLAGVFTAAGYRAGLYTSPHLLSFTERIRIDYTPVAEDWVVDFVSQHDELIAETQPSFFELTVAMAFSYFREQEVDLAIVEVGLGGRLDSTNIITPELSVITNIGLDHQAFLGDTLEAIAREKAGIIKPGVPVVIGERQPETTAVFEHMAYENGAPLHFADEVAESSLMGAMDAVKGYQRRNLRTALAALSTYDFSKTKILEGLQNGLAFWAGQGRLMRVSDAPQIVVDVAHNPAGIHELLSAIAPTDGQLHVLMAVSNDKAVAEMLAPFSAKAHLHATSFDLPRAMPTESLAEIAAARFEHVTTHTRAADAYQSLSGQLAQSDTLLVCGSIFLVAEVLAVLQKQ